MFGKKKQKDYQKMLKARKNKDYIDYYEDYFEGDEIEEETYYEDSSYDEDGQGDEYDSADYCEDQSEDYADEELEEEDIYEDEEEYIGENGEDEFELEGYEAEESYEEDEDFDIENDEDDDFDYEYESDEDDRAGYDAAESVNRAKFNRKAKNRLRAKTEKRKKLSGADWVAVFMGICILIIALVTGMLYADSRMIAMQVASFATVGAELDDIHIIGESGLLAVGAAQEEKLLSDMEEPTEDIYEEPDIEEEEPEDEIVTVVLKVTSIQSDIKVKFVNKSSEKLIGGVPFSVHVKGDNGKEFDLQDDDKDGVIYRTEIPNGTYKVHVEALSGSAAERYKLPVEAVSVKVTDTIAYKKVDVKDEIKKESQVNAAIEDTAVQDTVVESTLQDTVEWVESTKTPISTETIYEEVKESDIEQPTAARAAVKNSFLMRFMGAENITVNPSNAEIEVGGTIQLSVSAPEGTDVSWSSDNSSCASVSASGVVTGVSAGTASITASSDGATASCSITVKEKAEETDPPAVVTPTITLSTSGASVKAGESMTITAVVENNNDNKGVEWKSSDASIATVSGGTVTGIGKGTVTITAALQGTEISASCTVEVTEENKKSISLDATEVSLTVGAEATVKATVGNTSDEVVWSSSDKNVATVDGGKIKGLKEGKATVTAALKADSSISASCTVTVTAKKVNATAPLKDKNGNQLYIKKGDGTYVEATAADYLNGGNKFYRKTTKDTGYRYTGWQTIEGYTYFFDKAGNYVTGEQVIQGAKYTFGSDGKLSASSGTLGIDVSKWNGNIDWNAVRNSGVSFVIIRCGYRGSTTGALIEDPKFRANIKGAKAAGLSVGVYFFTQATNEVEAVEEASMAISLISGYGVNLPVYLDVESSGGRGDRIDAGTRTAVCKAFCATIQNSGYKAGIYANKTWLTSYINTSALTSYKIWLAQYAAAPTYTATRYDMWQYSSKGSVSGISGNVDMNIRYN